MSIKRLFAYEPRKSGLTNAYQGDGSTTCGGRPGQLCSTTDGLGHVTSYGYDSAGNLASTAPAPLGVTTIVSDALSRTASRTDGKGQQTTFSYDAIDRLTQARYAGASGCTPSAGTCVSYAYDADGNQTSRVDGTGSTSYGYDSLGRPTSTTAPGGTVTLGYDAADNLTSDTDPGGTVSYGYDPANEVTSLAEPGGSCRSTPTTRCTTFGYDADGARTSTSYPSGVTVPVTYDASGRETAVKGKRSGTTFVSRAYRYLTGTGVDTALVQKVTDQAGVVTKYGYDPLNRLTSAITGSTTLSYGYDGAGNRTSGPEGAHSYNAADELTDTGYGYDAGGSLTAGGGRSYTYTPADQTASVTSSGTTTPMSYAGVDSTERTAAGATSFLTGLSPARSGRLAAPVATAEPAALRGAAVATPAGPVASQTTNAGTPIYFTRDPAGSLVSMRIGAGATSTNSYYLTDALGSVLSLTNATGADTASYSYDPYGTPLTATGTQATVNPWRFAGGYLAASGLTKFGTRYYDAGVSRWTQRDSDVATSGGAESAPF